MVRTAARPPAIGPVRAHPYRPMLPRAMPSRRPSTRRLPLAAVLAVLFLLPACAPSLAPLYSDYEVRADAPLPDDALRARIEAALEDAGWTITPAPAPNAVATEAQTFRRWGLYDVTAALEVVPFRGDHVRIYVHPYRHYVTGGRSKIPYLSGRLRASVLRDLNASLAEQGLVLLGTPEERDEDAVALAD